MSDTLAESRLFLLYLFLRFPFALTNDQITGLALDSGIFNYFEVQESLIELTQSSLLELTDQHPPRYAVSEQGQRVLRIFEERLRPSWRQDAQRLTEKNMTRLERESTLRCDYEKKGPNEFWVTLRVVENDEDQMRLVLRADNERQASHLCKAWPLRGVDVYRDTIMTLGAPLDEGDTKL